MDNQVFVDLHWFIAYHGVKTETIWIFLHYVPQYYNWRNKVIYKQFDQYIASEREDTRNFLFVLEKSRTESLPVTLGFLIWYYI